MSLPRLRRPTCRQSRMPEMGLRLVRGVSTAGVLAVVVLAQVGLVLAPSQLGRRPLLVLAMRPTPAFLVLMSELMAPATAILIAAVGRTLVDAAYFAVARYGALPLAERFGVGRSLTSGVSRRSATRGLLTVSFFWSSTPVIAALGLGATPILKFLTVTGVGNAATSSAFLFFGRRFSAYLAPVTAWVSARGTQLSIGLACAMALGYLVALRRTRRPDAIRGPILDRGGRRARGRAGARGQAEVTTPSTAT